MPLIYTPQSLTRRLVSYNTVNPPGNEQECATFIGDLLGAGGFDVGYHEFAPRRTSLVARKIFNINSVPDRAAFTSISARFPRRAATGFAERFRHGLEKMLY